VHTTLDCSRGLKHGSSDVKRDELTENTLHWDTGEKIFHFPFVICHLSLEEIKLIFPSMLMTNKKWKMKNVHPIVPVNLSTGIVRMGVSNLKRKIIGFHQDQQRHWVADLECGHQQHVRHDPPLTRRPWVLTAKGRKSRIGIKLDCKKCDESEPRGNSG
jgi:Protein of unknown function (DUF3565)